MEVEAPVAVGFGCGKKRLRLQQEEKEEEDAEAGEREKSVLLDFLCSISTENSKKVDRNKGRKRQTEERGNTL